MSRPHRLFGRPFSLTWAAARWGHLVGLRRVPVLQRSDPARLPSLFLLRHRGRPPWDAAGARGVGYHLRLGDEMHRTLRRYKDAASATTRHRAAARCAGLLSDFVDGHRQGIEALAGGPWDTVVTVPSSTGPSRWPVDAVVCGVGSLAADHRRLLVKGTGRLDHLQAHGRASSSIPESIRARFSGTGSWWSTTATPRGREPKPRRPHSAWSAWRSGSSCRLGRVIAPRSCPWHAAFWAAYVKVRPRATTWAVPRRNGRGSGSRGVRPWGCRGTPLPRAVREATVAPPDLDVTGQGPGRHRSDGDGTCSSSPPGAGRPPPHR